MLALQSDTDPDNIRRERPSGWPRWAETRKEEQAVASLPYLEQVFSSLLTFCQLFGIIKLEDRADELAPDGAWRWRSLICRSESVA